MDIDKLFTKAEHLAKNHWRAFVGGLIAACWITVMQTLGFDKLVETKFNQIFLRQEARATQNIPQREDLTPKLNQKPNNFKLQSNPSFVQSARASEDYDAAHAYIVVDADTGKIITEKDSSSRIPQASLTKVMTAVTALDLTTPEELFTVTQRAADTDPTKIGVVTGEKMALSELLNAALLTSANDAVQVINDGFDTKYGDGAFIDAMNKKAELIGLNDSHFQNAQGFDGNKHYSSAADLAVLTKYALDNYPQIREIVKKDYEFLPANSNHKQFDLYNWNGLLGVYPGVYGVKIGNTDNAANTTIVISERSGHRLIVVLLGAPSIPDRDYWAAGLLDYGFEKDANLPAVNITRSDLKAKYATWKFF
jgi:serine-type D-Ala-D-Ala carboxypeptidase (penicillin-binding protein 5/6)